jgi:hypothetical protein
MSKETKISTLITIIALLAVIAHIIKPTMMIDSITLWLLVIAFVPWLAPLVKSIEGGGVKLEFQERLNQLETDTAKMHTEMEEMAQTLDNMMEDVPAKSEQLPNTVTSLPTLAFVHVADAHNTKSNFTVIDNSLTNNNPNAILMVTQNWSPPKSNGGIYNPQSIGVWYTEDGKWTIFNQDRHVDMPEGAAFNVQVLGHGGRA